MKNRYRIVLPFLLLVGSGLVTAEVLTSSDFKDVSYSSLKVSSRLNIDDQNARTVATGLKRPCDSLEVLKLDAIDPAKDIAVAANAFARSLSGKYTVSTLAQKGANGAQQELDMTADKGAYQLTAVFVASANSLQLSVCGPQAKTVASSGNCPIDPQAGPETIGAHPEGDNLGGCHIKHGDGPLNFKPPVVVQ